MLAGKFLGGFSSRVGGVMQRTAAGSQSIALRILQNVPRPKEITALRGLEHLLEERFFFHPTLHIGG
jgi:hypothetical protein